jgi:hypothetical protein
MRNSRALSELLETRLQELPASPNSVSLRERLLNIKLTREPPKIKESPENIKSIESED